MSHDFAIKEDTCALDMQFSHRSVKVNRKIMTGEEGDMLFLLSRIFWYQIELVLEVG